MADIPTRHRIPFAALDRGWVVVPVLRLFLARGPAAIAGRVRAVVVDTLKGVQRCGLGSHVSEKYGEGLVPRIVNGNPATAVAVVVGCLGVGASLLHGHPASVFGGPAVSVFGDCVDMQAPTGPMLATRQVCRGGDARVPTLTPTQPASFLAGLGVTGNDGQPTEHLPGEIHSFSHALSYTQGQPEARL